MKPDYFDRLCTMPGTVVFIRDEAVDNIWANRHNLYIPHKANGMKKTNAAFYELVKSLADGKQYAAHELPQTAYWESIKRYHKSWQKEPLSERAARKMRRRCWDGIKLFWDIKKRGMINPLDIIVENNRMMLYRGNRRLQILKALGTETAKVRYAVKG